MRDRLVFDPIWVAFARIFPWLGITGLGERIGLGEVRIVLLRVQRHQATLRRAVPAVADLQQEAPVALRQAHAVAPLVFFDFFQWEAWANPSLPDDLFLSQPHGQPLANGGEPLINGDFRYAHLALLFMLLDSSIGA